MVEGVGKLRESQLRLLNLHRQGQGIVCRERERDKERAVGGAGDVYGNFFCFSKQTWLFVM